MATAKMKSAKIVEVRHEGKTYTLRALDRMFEEQVAAFAKVRDAESYGVISESYVFLRVMGVDTTGLDMSDVQEILDAWADAGDTTEGESSGSETSSEPTPRRSSSRSSTKG